MVFDEEGTWD
jgi:hypothetical protein